MKDCLEKSVIENYSATNQEHLFKWYDTYSKEEKIEYINNLKECGDPKRYLEAISKEQVSLLNKKIKRYNEIPKKRFFSLSKLNCDVIQRWESIGLESIAKNEVCVIVIAGGQGTRLNSTEPKGCYNVNLFSKKTLFQIQAEKILTLQNLANAKLRLSCPAKIYWYIMTSPVTRKLTEDFFLKSNFFGLIKDQIKFFDQKMVPCFNMEGNKILMETKKKILMSPDGNGGFYDAIFENKIIDEIIQKGIKHMHVYCVDNILAKVADPVFFGFAIEKKLDLATKVVLKKNDSEKVGVVVLDEELNRPCIAEYTEISEEMISDYKKKGLSFIFNRANIVNHYFSVDFFKQTLLKCIKSSKYLKYHIVKKKNNFIDDVSEKKVISSKPNCIKLEKFIFDVFPYCELEKFGCLDVNRSEEFSPLKNSDSEKFDCSITCKNDYLKLSSKWVKNNNGSILCNSSDHGLVEVSPLTSYFGEGLDFVNGMSFNHGDII